MSVHQDLDGTFRSFLAKHLQNVDPALVHPWGIEIPPGAFADIRPGDLQEDFELRNIKGGYEEIKETLIGLIDRFYTTLGLKCVNDSGLGGLSYIPRGGMSGGFGAVITYTIDISAGRILVSVQNFPRSKD